MAAAIVLAVALGGCAGSEATAARNDYVKALNAAQERFARTAEQVSGAIGKGSSVRQERRTLVRYGAEVGGLVRTLRSLTAPGAVRTEHAGLVAALAEFRREVSAVVIRLRSGTTRGIDEAHRRLTGATITLDAKLGEATRAINRKLQAD
ncbi:MAG: hypothetical protein ACRDLN_05880 [Solirubrobacteraceae bacterium]